jgi:hypothetical protein
LSGALGASLGSALNLPTNNRIDWIGLPGTNTLQLNANINKLGPKKFTTLAQGTNVIKLLHLYFMKNYFYFY